MSHCFQFLKLLFHPKGLSCLFSFPFLFLLIQQANSSHYWQCQVFLLAGLVSSVCTWHDEHVSPCWHAHDYLVYRHYWALSCFAEPEPGVFLQPKHQAPLRDVVFPLLDYQQAHAGCCRLLSPALICHPSFPDPDSLPLVPWSCPSPSALPASLSQALWLQTPATSQPVGSWLARQGSQRGTVWGIDGSCWDRERRGKAGLYCLAACWVKSVGLKGKRKGKGLLSIFFSRFSLCAFK